MTGIFELSPAWLGWTLFAVYLTLSIYVAAKALNWAESRLESAYRRWKMRHTIRRSTENAALMCITMVLVLAIIMAAVAMGAGHLLAESGC